MIGFDRHKLAGFLQTYAVLVIGVVLIVMLSLLSDSFLTLRNLQNILNQNAPLAIMASAMTLVIIGGGFDLSVAAIFAVAGVAAAWVALNLDPYVGLLVAPPIALACWAALGAMASAWALGWTWARSRAAMRTAVALAALAALFAAIAFGEYIGDRHWRSVGIITAETVEVFSGPGERYASRFNLDAGDEATIIQTRGGWSRISVPGSEFEGWIRQSGAETVIAR